LVDVLGNILVNSEERGILQGFEVVDNVEERAVLEPDSLVVLSFLIEPNILKLLLEVKRIAHLVEQESKEKIRPALVKSFPAIGLPLLR